jgi:hypothetical protein
VANPASHALGEDAAVMAFSFRGFQKMPPNIHPLSAHSSHKTDCNDHFYGLFVHFGVMLLHFLPDLNPIPPAGI